ncbi:hypothetical protein KO516_16955 [Citreicella sp. C3M06]|uniref:hypothetical protein n=1 Tax=Citreicella sp. C3M06 TaxID=2841564 RepID=UPI001C08212A|nr:hypothetical protein [Citreicella sp. C3M06]MBU2962481.1 hypothetical protein [Citreicella sp. C3M06]
MQTILILAITLSAGAFLAWPRLAKATLWRATITPLASIIGSGFLVLGPVLNAAYGGFAPLAMAALCLVAWGFGTAIRANIARRAAGVRSAFEERVETLASWALAVAYFISVAYYLNLLGAFGTHLTPWNDTVYARVLTSAVLLAILVIGWRKGFAALERLEQVSVGLKLAIIAGLLAGLAWYVAGLASQGGLRIDAPSETGWSGLAIGFGLIVTVQGFETSRYLGDEYDAATRIRSMKLAQIVSAAIYMVYVAMLAYAFDTPDGALDETAIIGMMAQVSPILPLLLTAAALAAQFSAAVADTGGAGGLVEELTRRRVPLRVCYAALVGFGLMLTWGADVFQIIAYASRAFAAYYALQCLIAWRGARGTRAALFGALALLGAAITLFGVPIE